MPSALPCCLQDTVQDAGLGIRGSRRRPFQPHFCQALPCALFTATCELHPQPVPPYPAVCTWSCLPGALFPRLSPPSSLPSDFRTAPGSLPWAPGWAKPSPLQCHSPVCATALIHWVVTVSTSSCPQDGSPTLPSMQPGTGALGGPGLWVRFQGPWKMAPQAVRSGGKDSVGTTTVSLGKASYVMWTLMQSSGVSHMVKNGVLLPPAKRDLPAL
nr:uncharacterized protein LOC105495070 [Macaca nemestrina]